MRKKKNIPNTAIKNKLKRPRGAEWRSVGTITPVIRATATPNNSPGTIPFTARNSRALENTHTRFNFRNQARLSSNAKAAAKIAPVVIQPRTFIPRWISTSTSKRKQMTSVGYSYVFDVHCSVTWEQSLVVHSAAAVLLLP